MSWMGKLNASVWYILSQEHVRLDLDKFMQTQDKQIFGYKTI